MIERLSLQKTVTKEESIVFKELLSIDGWVQATMTYEQWVREKAVIVELQNLAVSSKCFYRYFLVEEKGGNHFLYRMKV